MASVLILISSVFIWAEDRPSDVRHAMVYYGPGRFGGWPANHEILSAPIKLTANSSKDFT